VCLMLDVHIALPANDRRAIAQIEDEELQRTADRPLSRLVTPLSCRQDRKLYVPTSRSVCLFQCVLISLFGIRVLLFVVESNLTTLASDVQVSPETDSRQSLARAARHAARDRSQMLTREEIFLP